MQLENGVKSLDLAVREKDNVVKANLEHEEDLTQMKEKVAALDQDKFSNEKQFSED